MILDFRHIFYDIYFLNGLQILGYASSKNSKNFGV